MPTLKAHSMAGACGLCLLGTTAFATTAFAEEPAAVPEPPPAAPASPTDTATEPPPAEAAAPSTTINIDIETASAYIWRGLNLFGKTYTTQTMALFPSVTAMLGPVTVGYWGAYQLTGDNKTAVVDGGVGAEQDFVVAYNGSAAESLAYSARLTYYVYPFADEEVAGVSTPMYLEPGVSLTYSTVADLGLFVCYYAGLQDATKDYSFVYFNPTVGKTLPIAGDTTLALSLGAGYKIHTGDYPPLGEENDQFDLAAHVGATIPLSDVYITPQVHAAYLTKKDTDFGDEFIAWAGVHLGYNIGL
jgi:hypothetical protein